MGIREQTARKGLEYLRSREQTARKGLECLGIREQTAREETGEQIRSKGTRVIWESGSKPLERTRESHKQVAKLERD